MTEKKNTTTQMNIRSFYEKYHNNYIFLYESEKQETSRMLDFAKFSLQFDLVRVFINPNIIVFLNGDNQLRLDMVKYIKTDVKNEALSDITIVYGDFYNDEHDKSCHLTAICR